MKHVSQAVRRVAFGCLALGLAGLPTGCGKKDGALDAGAAVQATRAATAAGATGATTAEVGEARDAGEPAGDAGGAADVGATDEAAKRAEVLAALAHLEIDGVTRGRGDVGPQTAQLQFDDKAPNGKGQVGTIELAAGFCQGCVPVEKATFEARRDELKKQLGEMHAKNAELVLDIGELELMPERKAVAIYTRSFVIEGEARALVHTIEVFFVDNGRTVHMTAYPRSGIPASAKELEEGYTRAELEALARKVFQGVAKVLWPPAPTP